jgi:hypothetical protein
MVYGLFKDAVSNSEYKEKYNLRKHKHWKQPSFGVMHYILQLI